MPFRLLLRCLPSALLGACLCGPAAAVQLEVFIMAGQSNMVGAGDLTQAPFINPSENPGVRHSFYIDGIFEDWGALRAAHAGGNPNNPRRWYGPEMGFGLELLDHGITNAAFIKYAQSGTTLATAWAPGGNLRNGLFSIVDQQLAKITAAGDTYRIAGFVWVQGENDANVPQFAAAYDVNLANLITDIETHYGPTTTVINRLHSNVIYAGTPTVRARQTSLADSDADVYLADVDDLTLYNDRIHYHTQSMQPLGRRLAQAWLGTQRLPGDFNNDGTVDAADYTVWRDMRGATGNNPGIDATGNLVVDDADLDVWRANFGRSSVGGAVLGSPSAIPEPSSIALAIAVCGLAVAARTKRSRREPHAPVAR